VIITTSRRLLASVVIVVALLSGCATRDGLRLEAIWISVKRMGKKLEGTRRLYQPSMLPHEIAELTLGLLEARDDTKNFQTEQIELKEVVGVEGYEARARFVDAGGLPKRLLLRGAALHGYVCEFGYVAAETAYYERYLPAYEEIVSSALPIEE